MTVPINREPITNFHDLLDFVGYVNDRHALLRQSADHPEEDLYLIHRQRGRRLVHNNQFCVAGNRPNDLDHLAGRHGDLPGYIVVAQRDPVFIKKLLGLPVSGSVVQMTALDKAFLHAKPDIFRRSELLHQIGFLVDHGDPGLQRVCGTFEMNFFAHEANRTFVPL